MKFEKFRAAMVTLIQVIVEKGDRNGTADKAKIDKLSAASTAANAKVQELVAALAAKDIELATALAQENASALVELDALSTELEQTFNPTATADAVAEAVVETPEIETPEIVEEATTIGTNEETSQSVTDAAVEAIAEMDTTEV
jgi:outer membrane murein-binding lipoprotein Lpp